MEEKLKLVISLRFYTVLTSGKVTAVVRDYNQCSNLL